MTVRMRARPRWVSAEEVARHPYVADCHIGGCFYSVACTTLDEAIWEQISHRCPRRGDPMTTGPSILDRAWAQLDAQVDEIYALAAKAAEDHNYEYEVAFAKAKARGKAEILALLMHPYYVDADEISLEAAARAQARTTGTPHRTLGLDPAHAGADLEAVQRARAS